MASVPSVALLQSLLILQWSFVGSQAHRRAMAQHNAELLQSAQKINEDPHDMCWGKQGCCWSLWGAICSGLTSCCQSTPAPEAGVRTDNESIRTKLLSGTGQGTESDKMKELCVGRPDHGAEQPRRSSRATIRFVQSCPDRTGPDRLSRHWWYAHTTHYKIPHSA